MMRLIVVVFLTITLMNMARSDGGIPDQSPEAVRKWIRKLPHAKEELTELHFYFHDTPGGKNLSDAQVAQANITSTSPTVFGHVSVVDNPLTEGPKPDSKAVGFAQGIHASASKEEVALFTTINFVFTQGKYNGSTLSILGSNPVFHKHRELPIVGGSGVFRLARGLATATTYMFNTTSGNAIVELHVVAAHYS